MDVALKEFPVDCLEELPAENAALAAMDSPGVAYFSYGGSEYFVATNHAFTTANFDDAIVKLVGITDIHHATNSGGLVTLQV